MRNYDTSFSKVKKRKALLLEVDPHDAAVHVSTKAFWKPQVGKDKSEEGKQQPRNIVAGVSYVMPLTSFQCARVVGSILSW